MRSSLTFQMLLHLGSYLIAGFAIFELAIILYKLIVLPYPGIHVFSELVVLVCFCLCETIRIFFSWKGNLTESASNMIVAIVMIVPGVMGVIYFLVWQTYILRIEVILCALTLTMQSLHLIFSLISMITFSSA